MHGTSPIREIKAQIDKGGALASSMAESPVTIVKGGTLAQTVVASAPEGMLIAPAWKRVTAFMLDVIMLVLVLQLLARGEFLPSLFSYGLVFEGARYAAFFALNWVLFGAAFYLYFKYTGQTMGRSLAQRGLRIAIVHDNGTMLEGHHWGPRAFAKLIYLIPILGALWFGVRDTFNAQSKGAEYRTTVDRKHHTVAAVDWSLPSETRTRLR
ncbi:MAG: hypothetical protein DWC07_04350 [Candidatus Poseidoniales archaeon]|nr:MAG: hypothetical protein DWC07_04350 [Candidatus Poseidoniales archaeon]